VSGATVPLAVSAHQGTINSNSRLHAAPLFSWVESRFRAEPKTDVDRCKPGDLDALTSTLRLIYADLGSGHGALRYDPDVVAESLQVARG
jgi:hypothetical protein